MKTSDNFEFIFKEQTLILSPEKAIFWKNRNALILSDLHLGKAGHFRKSGIAVPKTLDDSNLTRLDGLIKTFSPSQILFLGDLFHSDKNEEWESFRIWKAKHFEITMHLAIGNHDFHPIKEYQDLGLNCSSIIEAPPFLLVHDVNELKIKEENRYSISGHVHPSIRMVGKGRQSVRFPCYYFGNDFALLPAFGTFTGTHIIKPQKNDYIFAVVKDQVVPL